MRQFRMVHFGVAAALAAATVTSVGLVGAAGAATPVTSSVFVPITPCRLLDTRTGSDTVGGRSTPIGATETATFAVWGTNGNCTIPNGATGIATNATAVNPTAASYVTVFPADANPRPTASNLNVVGGGAPTPNQVTVGLSAAGAISIYNNAGTVDMIIDIVGYYQPATSGTPGPPGPAGPLCPVSGCTIVHTGSDVSSVDGATTRQVGGCVSLSAGGTAELALDLPVGAKITNVTVSYVDPGGGVMTFQVNHIPALGTAETIASAVLSSSDSPTVQTTPITFASPLPAYAGQATNYIYLRTQNATEQFCGATVTYTF